MMTLKAISLVNELRKNSRRSLTEIGNNAGIPLSSVFKMMVKIQKGTVRKNVTLVDFTRLGFPFKVGLFLSAGKKDEIKDFLLEQANLNTLLRLSGDYNFYAEFLFKDMAEYQDFMEELNDSPLVSKFSPHFITDIKQEEFKIGGER